MGKTSSSFYCSKKKCRKTAWDTPGYLTAADWDLVKKVLQVKTGVDYSIFILEVFTAGMAEGFFNRILGWPEGIHYCQRTSYIEFSAWPSFCQHEREKLNAAAAAHFGLFD